MQRSSLHRALRALSLALPVACGDSSSTLTSEVDTAGSSSSGGTSDAPTTSVGTSGTPTTSSTSSSTSTPPTSSEATEGGSGGFASSTSEETTGSGPNVAPVALSDRYITKAKQVLVIDAAMGLLKNDYDDNSDPLSLVAADPLTPGGAQVTAMASGAFTYQPPLSLWGSDSFTYTIWDSIDGFATTKVRVDVNPTTIDLEYIAEGLGGFVIDGQNPGDYSGRSVHAVGDLNGDGLGEVVVAARNAAQNTGRVYVVFGQFAGQPVTLSKLAEQGKGYVIHGELPGDFAGTSVAGAGDVDGDGKDDLIIGAPKASPNGKSSGCAYIVFGKEDSEPLFLDLVGSGNGGFSLNGEKALDAAARSVAGAGDVNGDGLADILVGAYGSDPGGSFSGAAYLVFGHGISKPTELADIGNGKGGGFMLTGQAPLDFAGFSVAGAGDVNGDGLADILVGAYGHDSAGDGAGRAYLVFGRTSATPASLTEIAAGQGGFAFDGAAAYDRAGFSLSGTGDINGDGFADLAVGAPLSDAGSEDSGAVYVLFGGPGLKSGSLPALGTGIKGFTLDGMNSRDYAGTALERAGDVNADGFDDLLIGAPGANPNGGDSGRAYVIFGDDTPLSVNLGALAAGEGGFSVAGEAFDDYSGFSVASGDINGDGHSDLITGARGNDSKGDDAGRTYVVFGGDFTNVLYQTFGPGPDNITGSDLGDSLVGGRGGDLFTLKGPDIVYAGAGDDDMNTADLAFLRAHGGAGADTLRLTTTGITLDLTKRSDLDILDIETFALGSGNTLIFSWRDLRALASSSRTISITGTGSTVTANLKGAGFTQGDIVDGFRVFSHPVVTLLIAETLQADLTL